MGRLDCTDEEHTVPFCGECTNCVQKKSTFEPISRDGVTILLDLFISSSDNMVFTMDNTVKYIKDYMNSQELIFGTNHKKYELLRIKNYCFSSLHLKFSL